MPAPTFAEQRLAVVEAQLLKLGAVDSASVGGNSIKYRQVQELSRERQELLKEIGIANGTFQRATPIYLAGAG